MKTFFNILALVLVFSTFYGQTIGINSTGAVADNSAMLDVVATDKGLLIPRVTLTGTNDITTITNGNVFSLLVFNTVTVSDVIPGYYFWDGAKWVKLMDTNTNADHDWYEVGGTIAPNDINNNIFTQGNVGVGTTNPTRKLHISGSGIGVQKFKIEETSVGGESMSLGNGTAASTLAFSNTGDFWLGGVANVDNNMLATDADIFIEGATGNTGIGTSTPQAKLNIPNVGTITTGDWTQASLLIGDATTGLAMDFNEIYTKASTGLLVGAHSNAPILFVTNATTKMRVTATGDVGIGVTVPTEKLHVAGNILASGTITSSDIRYKKEVSKLENSSNLLLELNPVSYYFKSQEFKEGQFDDRKHFGLIAQDVEKILPNLVYDDNDGYKAINYTEIIALLIKSNQELQNRIEALERQ